MKKGLKRKKDEPISKWIIRICKNLDLSEEMTRILFAVRMESYDEGFMIGREVEKINQIKNNDNE